MKKNTLAFLLSLTLVAATLAGCGQTPASESTSNPTKSDAPASSETAASEATDENGTNFDLESRTVTLNNRLEMPILGIGTFNLTPEQAEESVYNALQDGYRFIDTANAYMNERGVGRGIKRSDVPREEIFVTTKLWVSEYDNVETAIDETLARLDLEYVDLLLLHQPYGDYMTAYPAMEKAVEDGKVRAIGLSNFYTEKFDEIMSVATIPPAVLQIETNPLNQQMDIRPYLAEHGTVLEAWSPLGGRGHTDELFNNEVIAEIAGAHGKSVVQTILRWHMQIGNVAIPGSTNADHIQENIEIFDFELTEDEMERIAALDTGVGVYDFSSDEGGDGYTSFSPDFNAQE